MRIGSNEDGQQREESGSNTTRSFKNPEAVLLKNLNCL